MKWGLLPFILLFIASFVYTRDLKQVNSEYLFLTKEGISELNKFKEDAPELNSLIVQSHGKNEDDIKNFELGIKKLSEFCFDRCEVVSPIATDSKYPVDEFSGKMSLSLVGESYISALVIALDGDKTILKEIIELFSKDSPFVFAGHAYTNYLLDQYSAVIQEKLFPMMFAFSFVLLLLITKSLRNSLILFFPCVFSSVFTLMVLKLIWGSMNMVTSIIPLMGFVITLSLGQHLYFSLQGELDLKAVLKHKYRPIFLMIFTTFVGFFSLYLSKIEVIKHFGVLTAIMIVISTFICIAWLMVSEKLIDHSVETHDFEKLLKYFPKKTLKKSLIYILAFVSLFAVWFFEQRLQVVTDATNYFPKESKLKENIDLVSRNIGGIPIAEILITGENLTEFERIKEIYKLELEIAKISSIKIISNNFATRDINYLYAKNFDLPENKFAYLALRSKMNESFKTSYELSDSFYHLTILGRLVNVDEYEQLIAKVEKILDENKVEYKVNGLYYNLMISQKEMVRTLFYSFLSSLIIIVFTAYLSIRKFKIISSFILVNILPVGLSCTFIYLFDMSINIATVMTYSISLGMVVDSSFHLIHSLETLDSYNDYLKTTIVPIITSSLILIFSFFLFIVEEFIPIKEFGLNLSFILFLGMLFDLFVLPTLYTKTNKISEYFYEKNL